MELDVNKIGTDIIQYIQSVNNFHLDLYIKEIIIQNENAEKLSSFSSLIYDNYESYDYNIERIKYENKKIFTNEVKIFESNNEFNNISENKIPRLDLNNAKKFEKEKSFKIFNDYFQFTNLITSKDLIDRMNKDSHICKYVIFNKYTNLINQELIKKYRELLLLKLNSKMKDNRNYKPEENESEIYDDEDNEDEGSNDDEGSNIDDDYMQAI